MISGKSALTNRELVEKAVVEHQLDGIVAVSGKSVVYLSGLQLPGTLGRVQDFPHTPRMNMVVWPRGESPTLIVGTLSQPIAQRTSWIEQMRVYKEYLESPVEVLADVLRHRGLAASKLAIEKRYFGASRWEELVSLLPQAEFVECAELLESVRNIKTNGEIALLKRAADILDEALFEVFHGARAGDTERELHARVISSLIRRGAQHAHGMFRTSSNPVFYGGESSALLQRGDIIQTDYVVYVENYAANLSRVAVVGEPSREQVSIYDSLMDIHKRTIDKILRPGVSAKDVYGFVVQELKAAGYPRPLALVGHSLGLWWHQEEPILNSIETRKLQAGMVLCLEPLIFDVYHIQDEILITDEDSKIISDRFHTDAMFVIET